ncbi:M2 family metallopeptidase [Pseudoduganella albidiflava]|uniref:Angiotensin-converting enzyme n=1 Tax=Pseudoduganella albidiflava TaxID=321983 RepID=A0A411WTD8_9BURK|nr:M2 family metallopeptidase [Pseudoduganella albidiflava]QBI00040.1 peptidase M2 family protein [Pseudoduganella albidiflava]GGY63459.1 angiotensin-converting enzyme [Pseudoduganella albidiflava]
MDTKPLVLALAPAVILFALGAGTAHGKPEKKAQAKSASGAAAKPKPAVKASAAPTLADAKRFLAQTETKFDRLNADQARADWVGANFITDDTEAIAAYFGELQLDAAGQAALAARRYNHPGLARSLSNSDARKLKLLQLTLMLSDPKERAAYAVARAALSGAYGKAKYCPTDGRPCMPLGELEKILATSRDPARLLDAWSGWHAQSPAYRDRYADFVQLSNKGAREMGYADTGALWRSGYDMPPEEFAFEMERLWLQVKPLYEALHEYTRYKLRAAYSPKVVPLTGPIPAHLFGNMWSQTWDNIYPLLQPVSGARGFDLTKVLEKRKTTPKQMTEYAERFYTSLGMPKLPASFWERSLLAKPRDREVVCHASAWTIDGQDDVRIKMCINPTAEDFAVIHHELGHVYYFLAYRDQPVLFRNGANDGFHEAIGDTVALSITPAYLKRIGLMDQDQEQDPKTQMGDLLRRALSKVAVLPWAYMVDRWRWDVYAGATQPADYDRSWWQLREQYMGIGRPLPPQAGGFDAGAKYHVPADVPYARYFLANLLQFQFHRALCREAGYEGPLHACSIHGNEKAGKKLRAMLELGTSKPWPEALKAISGEDRIDGGALLEYFAPLKAWLDEQNRLLAAQQKG